MIHKCQKCGEPINEAGQEAWIHPVTKKEVLGYADGRLHNCSIITNDDVEFAQCDYYLGIDIEDRYKIQGEKIRNYRLEMPFTEVCSRCNVKIGTRDDGDHYYNLDSSLHYCVADCECGRKVAYPYGPHSTLVTNLDHTDHQCPLRQEKERETG